MPGRSLGKYWFVLAQGASGTQPLSKQYSTNRCAIRTIYRLSEPIQGLSLNLCITHALVNYQVHLSPTLERKIRRGSMLLRRERTYVC